MDRVSCPGPSYKRVELVDSSSTRQSRSETSRPSSTDSSVRRSLTPTRIYQPIPKPWTATVSTGSNIYQQSYGAQKEPSKVSKKFIHSEITASERVCQRGGEQTEQHRSYRAELCEKEETICPEPPVKKVEPEEVVTEVDKEVMDLSTVVPTDDDDGPTVGGEHDLITETTEEDVDGMHVKTASTYEKTVEVVSSRAGTPVGDLEEIQSCSLRTTKKIERGEGAATPEPTEVLSSAIDATQMLEQAKREEEEMQKEREAEERRKQQEEEERRKREQEEIRKKWEEEERKKKHVSFSQAMGEEEEEEVVETIREQPLGRTVIHEEKITEADSDTPGRTKITKETYEEITEEVLVQERVRRKSVDGDRKRNLREQVEVHKSLRDQDLYPTQERRITSSQYGTPQDTMETCKKHVQFMKQTETGPKPLSQGPVPNSTPKEWKSEMCNALTTAPDRPYTPLSTSSSVKELYTEETIYLDHKMRPIQKPKEEVRPISPFQRALTIAPERPYTPLSREIGPDDQKLCRSETPVVQPGPDGIVPPADILYGERHEVREQICTTKIVPQPLPTPPPDYRLRDSSASPCRSRPCSRTETPSSRPPTATLRKPDTIPSYQRNLVAMRKGPVEARPYTPISRTPTPTPMRSKSPAQGPPEPPSYYTRAQAPRIREDTPPSKQSSTHFPSRRSINYHVEEDIDHGHRKQDYLASKTVHYDERERGSSDAVHADYQEKRWMTSEEDTEKDGKVCHVKRALQVVEDYERCEKKAVMEPAPEPERKSECAISKTSQIQPTLPCPLTRSSSKPMNVQPTYSSSTEVRHVRYDLPAKKCPETGVTVLPCKAHSDQGTKAGVVVVPCEGPEPSCPKSGVCVVPTADRSGVCVSPCFGLNPGCCGQPSGCCGREGGCNVNISNCPESGVCVAPCPDGSVCVAPCKKPGLPPSKTGLPFPQISFPYDEEPKSCTFQPIHKPKTNLSGQLARFTAKRNIPTIQLYKEQTQCDTQKQQQLQQQQCESKSYHCETKCCFYQSQCQSSGGQCQTQRHCQTQSRCQDQFHCPSNNTQSSVDPPSLSSLPDLGSGGLGGSKSGSFAGSSAPKRGRGILTQAGGPGSRMPLCAHCSSYVRGPFITALGQIWCPDHFVCVNSQCRRPLQDIGFVEEKGQLYCEYCFEKYIAPACNKCNLKIKGDCLNAIGKHFHPECFNCSYCGKLFGNSPFFLEEGLPYCEADWNELFTTKCFACGFPVEAGDRWVEALNNNYHSQCFNCTMCKKNLEGQSFYAKGGRPFCKNHAR